MTGAATWFNSLRHPSAQMRRLEASGATAPLAIWVGFIAVAVVGSLVYGASLTLVLNGWSAINGAVWLAASAGLGWCVFVPVLIAVTRRRTVTCVHACLVTMAYGEVVLVSGALLNFVVSETALPINPALLNFGIVGISNVVMAAVLAAQLRTLGVGKGLVLAMWFVVLNGSGACFFWLGYHLLKGSS